MYPEYGGDEYDAGFKVGYDTAWDKYEAELAAANQRIAELEVELENEDSANYVYYEKAKQDSQRIAELESECATDKCEISCFGCDNRFSVINGEDEVNWRCPVCALEKRLSDLVEYVCSPAFYAPNQTRRDEKVKAFLTPNTPAVEPEPCCGDLILSEDKTLWTCDGCGKEWPMLVTPIEPEYVMVKRRDIGMVMGACPCNQPEFTEAWDRLKAALKGKEKP